MKAITQKFQKPISAVLAVLLVVALAVVALGDTNDSLAGTAALQSATPNLDINAFVAKVNGNRSTPLTISNLLVTAAQNRANDRAAGNTSISTSTYVNAVNYMYTSLTGYSASSSTNMTADQLYNVWSGQSNLFSNTYTQVGLGAKQASNGTWHYVIILAKPVVLTAPGATIDNVGTRASQELDIVNLVNAARAAAGLCPLIINPQLTAAAQRHSDDMSARNVLEHRGGDNSDVWKRIADTGYPATYAGENILNRDNIHAAAAFDQWWNSPPHQANMMNGNFIEVGIALAGPNSAGKYYYTMVLAARGGGGCAELQLQQQQQSAPSGGGSTTGGSTTGGSTIGGETGGSNTGGPTGGDIGGVDGGTEEAPDA